MTEKENDTSTGETKISGDSCPVHGSNKSTNSVGGGGDDGSTSSSKKPGKSCKGCLYYSSAYKSDLRNPLCLGLTRSLPQVPRYIVGESEMEASKEGRNLTDFRYGCVGYSVYLDQKARSADGKEEVQTELPVCVGLEILVDRRVTSAEAASGPAHKKEGHGVPQPQPRTQKPTHPAGDEFLTRFTRNANLVALGVVKNLQKVGNRIKEGIDDIFYRRPK